MADYIKQDIIEALRRVGLKMGDTVFTHSNVGFFGQLEGAVRAQDYYQIFKEAIFEVIGPEGTWVMPTFSYTFCQKQDFDPATTPGVCGALTEMMRQDAQAIRSVDANFSVVAIGKQAQYLTENPPENSFGDDSFWERFLKINGILCNFNFDAASTMLHYVERIVRVPYRYDKPFPGKLIRDGVAEERVFYHFVYDLEKPNNAPDFTKFDRTAKSLGLARTTDLGKGQIVCISAADTVHLVKTALVTNPAFLIIGDEVELDKPVEVPEVTSHQNPDIGQQMHDFIKQLYPICRSLTGEGARATLGAIRQQLPMLQLHDIPSGTQVFDWKIPKEWNIKDAYVKNSKGERVIDFQKSNIHILNYSAPIKGTFSLAELREHLFTLPDYPDWIPYLTSYYKENWGFCLSHNQYLNLPEDTYEVSIDSTLTDGSLQYGELLVKGQTDDEILISTYICHPSLCNDNLSGIALTTFLAKQLQTILSRYSYRFLFIPETIGAITWLSLNQDKAHRIKHGLVATCVGDRGQSTYKRSRQGDAEIDRAVEKALIDSGQPYQIIDFFPSGSDERQYSSPGFVLPVGSLMRTPYAWFPEYHTSADNLDFVTAPSLADTYHKYLATFDILEHNRSYHNLNPYCEPQLGKRGLYNMIGGQKKDSDLTTAMFWVLNFSDGGHSLLDIALKAKIPFEDIKQAAQALMRAELLAEN